MSRPPRLAREMVRISSVIIVTARPNRFRRGLANQNDGASVCHSAELGKLQFLAAADSPLHLNASSQALRYVSQPRQKVVSISARMKDNFPSEEATLVLISRNNGIILLARLLES